MQQATKLISPQTMNYHPLFSPPPH